MRRQIAALVHAQTGIAPARLLTLSFNQLGIDDRDLFDIILEVEKSFQVIIPDEVPLQSLDDFVDFIQGQRITQPRLSVA